VPDKPIQQENQNDLSGLRSPIEFAHDFGRHLLNVPILLRCTVARLQTKPNTSQRFDMADAFS